jgi:hypothetical protein
VGLTPFKVLRYECRMYRYDLALAMRLEDLIAMGYFQANRFAGISSI